MDPSFEALDGARAFFGHAHGGVYRIEIPEAWNGTLVLYLRGSDSGTLNADMPSLRYFLIDNGYAWGATSYDRLGVVVAPAAEQTAAFWDLFVKDHGRPKRTILFGASMGGGGALVAAERYAERFDGALIECGIAGDKELFQRDLDVLVVGAIATGLDAQEIQPSTVEETITERIIPALVDESAERFDLLWAAVSGGARPFATEGLLADISIAWGNAIAGVRQGVLDNSGLRYELAPNSVMDSETFNDAAVRFSGSPAIDQEQFTGDIDIPVLTIHTTGDARVPIRQQQEVRRKVDASGREDLLVQRTVQDPEHCGLTRDERERAFKDLVSWVETGRRAEGEDLLAPDLSSLGSEFTLKPRLGSAEAESVTTAAERLFVSGTVTLDGVPYTGSSLFFDVEKAGLLTDCDYGGPVVLDGRYRRVIAPASERPRCGETGSSIVPFLQLEDRTLLRTKAIEWPAAVNLEIDIEFSSASRGGTPKLTIIGDVLDASGRRLFAGVRIDAYAGDTHCATASIPQFGTQTGFVLLVGDGSPSQCWDAQDLSFFVDGSAARPSFEPDGGTNLHVLSVP